MFNGGPRQPEMLVSNHHIDYCNYMIVLRNDLDQYAICFTKAEDETNTLVERFKQLKGWQEFTVYFLTQYAHHQLHRHEVWLQDKD
jgi:hypothetical protein